MHYLIYDVHHKDNAFPLTIEIKDENERNKAIFDIIKHCAIHGYPPQTNISTETGKQKEINYKIDEKMEKKAKEVYKKQLPTLGAIAAKEPDLMKLLAVKFNF